MITSINDFKIYEANNEVVWYHGSDQKFDSFENFKSSGPSALGIFATDDINLAEIFGENIYKVSLNYKKPLKISMDKWNSIRSKHAKDTEYFRNWKQELISKGYDSIYIKENITNLSSGRIMRDPNIVVVFDKLQINMI